MQSPRQTVRLPQFDRDVKKLGRKYRHAREDIDAFERLLRAGSIDIAPWADQVGGFGNRVVKKARVISQDLGGKSGGYRIWWLELPESHVLIQVYTHHDAPNERQIHQETVRRLRLQGY